MLRMPQRHQLWRAKNPFRSWRLKKKIRQGEFGAQLGVTGKVVQEYENGDKVPNKVIMAKIIKLMNIESIKFKLRYEAWLKQRPEDIKKGRD